MPGLSHPKWVKSRAKSLWKSDKSLSLRAIARQLKIEFGDDGPSYNAVRRWIKEWEAKAEGNAQTVDMEAIAS